MQSKTGLLIILNMPVSAAEGNELFNYIIILKISRVAAVEPAYQAQSKGQI